MKHVNHQTIIILTLSSVVLFSTGCVPKNANGSYTSAYSYHPYAGQQALGTRNNHNPFQPSLGFNHSSNTALANKIEQDARKLPATDYRYGANGPYRYD